MRGRDAADRDVGEYQIEREPRGALEAERREDRQRVGRGDQRPPVDVEDAEVDAVLGTDRNVVSPRAEVRGDAALEERAVDFTEVAHALAFLFRPLIGTDRRKAPL